ncbi:MAG: SLBB domain-containing protein [Chitinispirillaceae bacterium]
MVFVSTTCSAIIKPGQVLDIQVQTHPEFSGRYMVNDEGYIEYPLLADQVISNLTTSELMAELTYLLAKHIDNPLVLVSVVKKPEMTITVLGHVKTPGPVKTARGASIQEVIMLAGGPSEKADVSSVRIIHKMEDDIDKVEDFDLEEFMQEGNLSEMPLLQPDDVVILLAKKETDMVKVIGAVSKPGFFEVEDTINIFELIYLAGGPSKKADLTKVRRITKTDDKTLEEVLDIQAYIDNGQMDNIPSVNEGDVIIVYSKWFTWQALLGILNNILLFIVTIQSIRGAVE